MNKIYKEYLQNGVIDEDNAVDIIEEQEKEIERLNDEIIQLKMVICKRNLADELEDILRGDKE